MKPIATDTYDFPSLIERGYTYVDKTGVFYPLVDDRHGKQFFLARPRRFGKSLLVSTLKALFQGRRALFRGLSIDSSNYEWTAYPVIHLDMGSTQAETIPGFETRLDEMLDGVIRELGVKPDPASTLPGRFINIVRAAAASSPAGKVVVLIDEYDKPILNHIGKPEVGRFRDLLKQFYSVVKTCEGLQRFALITGVSKFSKVSIFSDLNNLIDITMDVRFATILGYTHEEVRDNFAEWVHDLGAKIGETYDEAFSEIVRWYDGYRFHSEAPLVFNPVSLGLCLTRGEFGDYWSETAKPTFLVEALKGQPRRLRGVALTSAEPGAYEPDAPNVMTLLYQTGYLTIKDCQMRNGRRRYTLDFPNKEVRDSFNGPLAVAYSNMPASTASSMLMACSDALYDDDLAAFFDEMTRFFANMPYDMSSHAPEETYQAVMCAMLWAIGLDVAPEVRTNEGRIDAVIETDRHIYVVEFKRNGSAEAALAQIRDKRYADKFLGGGKPVTLVGVNFDGDRRTIAEWKADEC